MTSSPDENNPLKLDIAVANRPQTIMFRDGRAKAVGVEFNPIEVTPTISGYRRMIRDQEFDVCEVAVTTYTIAREHGVPVYAIPVFTQRNFHHGDITCRGDSGIKTPKDLEGKRVGVRAYSVTTGVWVRGILQGEYDVDLDAITWVVDDEEHVQTFKLPGNVEHTAPGESISQLFREGNLQAALQGAAGIGRSGPPVAGWEAKEPEPEIEAYPLFPNAWELQKDWYDRTGIYPIHGTIVLKQELVDEHPWLPKSLFDSFTEAKSAVFDAIADPTDETPAVKRMRRLQEIVGTDPLPYGIEPNAKTLDKLFDYALNQGLLQERPTYESLFAPLV